MKTKETLEKEYENLEIDLVNKTNYPLGVKMYLGFKILDLAKNGKKISEEIKNNHKFKLQESFFKTAKIDFSIIRDYYEEDVAVIKEALKLVDTNLGYMIDMFKMINKDNCKEILKLYFFQDLYFQNNLNYLEEKRTDIECFYKGTSFDEYNHKDNRKVIDEFINERLSSLKENNNSKNNMQYTRK